MGKFARLGNDLYGGRKSIDFIGRKWVWYTVSLVLVGLAIAIIAIRGLNFGIEFTGGTQYRVSVDSSLVTQDNADRLRDEIGNADIDSHSSPVVTTAANEALVVQMEDLNREDSATIEQIIRDTVGAEADISQDEIGASWGREVAERAGIGVVVFLLLVVLFIWAYFREWKMSVAALIALAHDVIITIGIYALSGFPVTPSAVTGLLAILGFSMYDTVVVFDKVRENTHEMRKSGQTYAQAANLAVNQTLVRSINTSIVALIPIGAILYVSVSQLGASSLQDLALAQFVGMAVGIYSSVFIAPRLLVQMKGKEASIQLEERRAKAKAKATADKYAAVPVFAEGMPVADEDDDEFAYLDDEDGEGGGSVRVAPPRSDEAVGRGRVAPESHRPVQQSNAAGRKQPSRQPRSQRGKK